MEVDREAFWVLIGLCCLPSLVVAARVKLRPVRAAHPSWRDGKMAFAGACADALLTGLGIGLTLATFLLLLAAAWVKVT
jgi:hypothetical protein